MNMSFINCASPHEVLSFFTQRIYPSAKDWLTMEVIQSAIITSSLINPPLARRQPSLQFGTHTHTPSERCVCLLSAGTFLFSNYWDHGKIFSDRNGAAPAMAVLICHFVQSKDGQINFINRKNYLKCISFLKFAVLNPPSFSLGYSCFILTVYHFYSIV